MKVTGKINGTHTVIANFADRIVLAYNPYAVEPYVVWHLDRDGDPYMGTYTDNPSVARHEFCARIAASSYIRSCIDND